MFKTHKDRGRVLLAVRVHSIGSTLGLWVLFALVGCLPMILTLLITHRWKLSLSFVSLLCSCLSLFGDRLFHPWIKFQDGGVEIPANRDCRRVRFMRWNQIRRWSWDGDYLILTGANFQGGAVRIPGAERLTVDQIMSTKKAVRQGVDGPPLVSDPN